MYSQTLMKKTVDNLCVRCETRFKTWSEYHAHMTGPKCTLKIVPLKTSNRSKAEIVAAWETMQKDGVII